MVSWIKHSVDRFVIVSIFIPKLRLILILNSFLGSSDSLVFSELFHSLAPRPLAARFTNVRSSLMAVNIHITIIELNALHTKRQNLFQELDAVIHLLMEAKHWGLRKSRNATSLNSRFKSLDTLKVKIISVTFRRV